MTERRTEEQVAGHDPELRASMDELARTPVGSGSAGDPAGMDGEFDPHRFQSRTVPPAMLAAMAAVDLSRVDAREGGAVAAPEPPSRRAPRPSPGQRLLGNVVLAVGAVALVLALMLVVGNARRDGGPVAATSAGAESSPGTVTSAPASAPSASAAPVATPAASPASSAVPAAPPAGTPRPARSDPNRNPNRPLL